MFFIIIFLSVSDNIEHARLVVGIAPVDPANPLQSTASIDEFEVPFVV